MPGMPRKSTKAVTPGKRSNLSGTKQTAQPQKAAGKKGIAAAGMSAKQVTKGAKMKGR